MIESLEIRKRRRTHGNEVTNDQAGARVLGERTGKVMIIRRHQGREPEVLEESNHLGIRKAEGKVGLMRKMTKDIGITKMTKNGMERITLGKGAMEDQEHLMLTTSK